MNYCPDVNQETQEMLSVIGVKTVDDLFTNIPVDCRPVSFNLPEGKTEQEMLADFKRMSSLNQVNKPCFIGAGSYDHFIPSVVDALSSRAEFYTAYTPYQPEASQGTLTVLFEYQTMITRLTAMDVSNASLYDGGTACAEAALMAVRYTERSRVILDGGLNPAYRRIVESILRPHSCEVVTVSTKHDQTDISAIEAALHDDTACLIIQNPNFFGTLADHRALSDMVHAKGALMVMCVYPISLGEITAPGNMGADIAVGDAQSLGNPMHFGGPSLGFIAAKKALIRQMPGRIVGETVDRNGKRGFVLTLQAREQHIKRQKATSNICSNQGLCALRAVIYLSAYGRDGFTELSAVNRARAEKLIAGVQTIPGVKIWNTGHVYNEFVMELPIDADKAAEQMLLSGIQAGLPLSSFGFAGKNLLLTAVTEKRTDEEIKHFADTLGGICARK